MQRRPPHGWMAYSEARRLRRDYGTRRTGVNLFERFIYVLRHNMQHSGELQAMLRQMGLEPGDWRWPRPKPRGPTQRSDR